MRYLIKKDLMNSNVFSGITFVVLLILLVILTMFELEDFLLFILFFIILVAPLTYFMNILNYKFSFSEHNLGELVNEVFYSGEIIKQSQLDIMDEAYESIFRVYIKHKNTDN